MSQSTYKYFPVDERAAVAMRFRESGMTQPDFCKEEGICPRTLRNWIRLYAPSERNASAANVNLLIRGLYQAAETLEATLAKVEDQSIRIAVTANVTTAQHKFLTGMAKIQDTSIQRVLRDIIDEHLDRTVFKTQKSNQRKNK